MATFDPLRVEVRQLSEKAVGLAARKLEQNLRQTSPVDTGLMQSRTAVQTQGLLTTAKVATPYASYVAEGTRPHIVRPRRGKVLSFYWPKAGRRMFLPRVNHPGTRPNTWWDQALGRWHSYLDEAFR